MYSMVLTRPKKAMATLCATALACVAIAAPAGAQQQQDGLINVMIGDVTVVVEDVNVGVAVQAALAVCPTVQVGNVAVLAADVVSGRQEATTVCETAAGPLRFVQN
jgi:hypothetical protein